VTLEPFEEGHKCGSRVQYARTRWEGAMRFRLLPSIWLLSQIASPAWAVTITIAWTSVGNPGNTCARQSQGCFGAVGYKYQIGTYEVTNAQYAAFLNAKAAADPLGLYNTNMGSAGPPHYGGITRSGSEGSYTYVAIAGRGDMPVNWVSFYDALRFANWLNNGQGSGDTETGAYTLLGGTATPSNGTTVTRNAGAKIFLPSEDEWYKAAYYDASSASYFADPAGSSTQTACTIATATANHANCDSGDGHAVGDLTNMGSYTGSASPYGSFDQGGNVWEWNEAIINGSYRGRRGGSFDSGPLFLAASTRSFGGPAGEGFFFGFRVARIP
jgi:sulfatase modifying factor 1